MSRLTKFINNLGFSLSLLALSAGGAFANPEDPIVRAGDATFEVTGKKLDIHQSTQKAVIDWRSFNIAPDEHTEFHQPSSGSLTVNRVKSSDPSQIDGMLSANGRIVIINPNGVYFGQDARVDVGGLIATTADMRDEDIESNHINFNISGNPDAAIINHGSITVRDAGLIGLVAPHVENHGMIQANLGHATLASGDTMTLDLAGDGFISVAVDEDVIRSSQQNVENSGVIQADGGQIIMTAAAARNSVDNLIVNKGTLQANSVGMKNGKIVLGGAGSNKTAKTGTATTLNEGIIQASGNDAGEKGGHVEIVGDHVGLMTGSQVDASGVSGGGTVLVGGDYQGNGATQAALRTYVDESAFIHVGGLQAGDGGRAIVWADETTRYYGSINAEGGDDSGNGGFVEVSGKEFLDFNGTVSTKALNGQDGMLLLDPTNIEISTAVNTNVNGASPFSPTLDDGPSILNVTTLQTALASGSVTVQTRATGSQLGDITVSNPISWSANNTLTLDAHNKIIVNASITARNSLILTAADVDIAANLIENASGATLVFQPKSAASTIGIAGGAGAFNLTATDLGFIQAGWNGITIGHASGTGIMDVGARTWNAPLTLRSTTGEIQINGAQAMGANAMTLQTQNLGLNANLTGTGTLTITPNANTTIGLAGEAGTLNLTTTELNRIQNGWGSIIIGHTTSTAAMGVGAYTWQDPLTLRTGSGVMAIAGTQAMSANNLSLLTNGDIAINNALTGTGTLTIAPNAVATSIGIAGGAGTLALGTADLANITNGWGAIVIGSTTGTGAITANAATWNDSLRIQSATGAITVAGAQTMGANNLTIRSNANPAINAALTGTGTLTLDTTGAATTIGVAGGAGTYNLTTAELANITNGWGLVTIGSTAGTGAINLNAASWNDNFLIQSASGAITVAGAQTMGANNLTIRSNANPAINAALTGTGTLTLDTVTAATTIGLAGGAGTYNLTSAELANITNGWSEIVVGSTAGTGAITANASSWNDNLRIQSATGVITVAGAQNMGANNLTIRTNANPAINAALTGTGILTFDTVAAATTIGLAGGAGTLGLTTAELNNITNGWSQIVIGSTAGTGAITANAHTWNDALLIQGSTAGLTIAGTQTMGSNDLTISTGTIALNAALAGTGTLTLQPGAAATTIGLAGGAGTFSLDNTELNNISDGWSQVNIGRTDGTGAIAVNTRTWVDPLTIRGNTSALTVAGAQNMGANNLTLATGAIALNAALTGTGQLTLQPGAAVTTIGLAGGAGTFALDTTELNNIVNGWSQINIGRTDGTGILTANAHTWQDHLLIQSNTGAITIAGAQNMGANNLTIRTNGNPALGAALTGSGTLTFDTVAAATTIGLGGGAGTLALTASEIANITNGWSEIVIGSATGTGAITANALSWNDDLRLLSDTGAITIAGIQNFGTNNAIIESNTVAINAGLTGTGTLRIRPTNSTTTIGLAGGAGTLNLTTSELNNITNGWGNIIIGRSDSTAAMTVNAHTWNDNLTLLSNIGQIEIAGAQAYGSNDVIIESDSVVLNGTVSGTGTLTIRQALVASSIGLAGAAGTLNLGVTELDNIANGWSQVNFGRSDGTGAVSINAYSNWRDPVSFIKDGSDLTNAIAVSGTQAAFSGSNAAYEFDGNTNLAADLSTEGGDIAFLYDIDAGGTSRIIDASSGMVSFAAAATGFNNLTIFAGDLGIGSELTGTGNLIIEPGLTTTSMGLGGAAGDIVLSDSELDDITDGWSSLTFGRADGTGAINIDTYSNWRDQVSFIKNAGDHTNSIHVTGAQSTALLSDAAFSFYGNTLLSNDLTTDSTGITFLEAVSIDSNIVISTGSGFIDFMNTLNGSHDVSFLTTNNIHFYDDVGVSARLGNVTITNPANVISDLNFRVNDLTIINSSGTVDFSGAGLNATGNVDIEAQGITGIFEGNNGVLDSGAGSINAAVSFGTLDVSGTGATLSAGYIGTPGPANQDMANLITINSVLMPVPDPAFTFAGFEIGDSISVPAPQSSSEQTSDFDVAKILRQSDTFNYSLRNSDVFLAHNENLLKIENLLTIHGDDFEFIFRELLEEYPYLYPPLQSSPYKRDDG